MSGLPNISGRRASPPGLRIAYRAIHELRRLLPKFMAYDEKDAERVRRILAHDRPLVEKTMMGGLVFMVDGHMCCGLSRGTLMVRVGRESRERILTLPHVRPMKIGRRSPAAFVRIDPEGYRTDKALAAWVQRGVDFVSTLPAKMPGAKKAGRKAAPGKTTSRMTK